MRPGQQNNKNRSRGRGNNNGGRKHPNPLSRSYESNGPDVKIRGNAAHIAEKYQQLARDAHASGDSVMAENYLQHAEHYFRILSAAQPQGMPRPDQFGFEPDTEDEDAEAFAGESGDFNGRGFDEQRQRQNQNGRGRQADQQQPRIERPAFVSELTGENEGARNTAAPATNGAAGPAEGAPEAEAEAEESRRPRRSRRRRTPIAAEGQPDQAAESPQSEAGPELPAFLTAGGTAAE